MCEADRHCAIAPWYVPHLGQKLIHLAKGKRFVTACAGRRGGKTLSMAVEFVDRIFRDLHGLQSRGIKSSNPDLPPFQREPVAVYWVVAPTSDLYEVALRHFRRTLPKNVRDLMGQEGNPIAAQRLAPTPRFWLPGDILVEFKSGERPERLVSEGLSGCWLTEAARLKPNVWQENLEPALADKRGWVLSDSTPLGRNFWWSQFWRRGMVGDEWYDPNYANVRWLTIDNIPPPGVHNPEWEHISASLRDTVKKARAKVAVGGMSEVAFRREWEASFEAFQGAIYALNEKRHILLEQPDKELYSKFVAGFDYGRAAPAALLILGQRHRGGWDVLKEHYGSGKLSSTWASIMKEEVRLWKLQNIWADPSTPILPDLQNQSLPVAAAKDRDVLSGIEKVAGLLDSTTQEGLPGLRIHHSCKNTLRELGGYRWKTDTSGQEGDQPVKKDDHTADSLRYCISSEERTPLVWRQPW